MSFFFFIHLQLAMAMIITIIKHVNRHEYTGMCLCVLLFTEGSLKTEHTNLGVYKLSRIDVVEVW